MRHKPNISYVKPSYSNRALIFKEKDYGSYRAERSPQIGLQLKKKLQSNKININYG